MEMCKVVTLFLLIAYIDYTFGNVYSNGVILDTSVEYQRYPWLTLNITKFVNSKGSYNFKFDWNVVRNILDAKIVLQKWPLVPYLQPDGFYLNMTMVDKACDAIREDFFQIFSKSESEKPCVEEKNIIKKGHYYFEHNIDDTELIRSADIGTTVYVFDMLHSGAPLLRMRFLVDSNVLAIRKKHHYKPKRFI